MRKSFILLFAFLLSGCAHLPKVKNVNVKEIQEIKDESGSICVEGLVRFISLNGCEYLGQQRIHAGVTRLICVQPPKLNKDQTNLPLHVDYFFIARHPIRNDLVISPTRDMTLICMEQAGALFASQRRSIQNENSNTRQPTYR